MNKPNRKLLLTYDSFKEKVGNKRAKTVGMSDIKMMKFKGIYQNVNTGDYEVRVRLKKEYHKDYSFREEKAIMDNACMLHWGQWLNIGIMTVLFPNLINAYFFVTYLNVNFREPCFIDLPLEFTIKLLVSKKGKKKHEFSFLNLINEINVIYRVGFTVMKEEEKVLKYYHNKHEEKMVINNGKMEKENYQENV